MLYSTDMGLYQKIKDCFDRGGKLIIFGNGGSMAEASHMATEFIGIGYPAIALSDPATITALANDHGYEKAFTLWIDALYNHPQDLVISISSSGKSKNILHYQALRVNASYIDFPRKGKTTSEIQENQLKEIHKLYLRFKG